MALLTADQARDISLKNQPSIENVLELIQNVAKNGHTEYASFNLPEEQPFELMKLGYSVSICKGPFGERFHKISW